MTDRSDPEIRRCGYQIWRPDIRCRSTGIRTDRGLGLETWTGGPEVRMRRGNIVGCWSGMRDMTARILMIESYVTVLVLDPTQKAVHINHYWGEELLHDALQNTESMVCFPPLFAGLFIDAIFKYKEHYLKMYGDSTNRILTSADLQTASTGNHKLDALLDELSNGEEEETFQHAPSALSRTSSISILDSVDPSKPWLHDFHAYLNSKDYLGSAFCEDPSIMTEVDENLDKHEKGDGDLGDSWDTLVEDDECMDSEDGDVFVQMLDML
ncbi:uncharacterized protein HD556DRAFT_1460022 [Suillus plorans]|uniref:Uncharacterized protein n=1 Tax=Suillus plorans TaxID=116603 RepID=A0A9P7DN45_9AGAM|nr:uncharacterized protein HD556DRAFT_1460022 [Suillus plorans]KAG1798854.1 hypothetical protein HD556DRAFT_1460022 [Suillus plorans]